MNRTDLRIFLASALNNKRYVALHAIAGTTVIGATLGFTALLALYFDIDMFRVNERFPKWSILQDKTDLILFAFVVSGVLLAARIFQTLLEANVTISREKWFAERLRQGELKGSGNIARASNYYGRLSTASMNAASTVIVIGINLATMLVVLPKSYLIAVLAIAFFCSTLLYGAMKFLSYSMANSSQALAESGHQMSIWKSDITVDYHSGVELYYKSYFRRIFLASSFGLAPAIFAPAFCLALLIAQEFGALEVNLGEVFVAITLLQAYLSVAGRFFGAFVRGSAFLPAIRPYLGGGGMTSNDAFNDEIVD